MCASYHRVLSCPLAVCDKESSEFVFFSALCASTATPCNFTCFRLTSLYIDEDSYPLFDSSTSATLEKGEKTFFDQTLEDDDKLGPHSTIR